MKKLINYIKRLFMGGCPNKGTCKYYDDCPSCTSDFNEWYCGEYRGRK